MSLDSLGRLQAAHENLISALDGQDVEAIEAGVETLRLAIADVRGAGGWRETPGLKDRARHIAQLGEAARVRVNFLTDLTRQRLELLAAARGASSVYERPLKLVAEA
jgi:hypothetical protein